MPKDVTSGQVIWYEEEAGSLIGRNEIYNVGGGVASSFSCGGPCNCGLWFYSAFMQPGSLTSVVGDQGQSFVPMQNETDCSNTIYGPFDMTSSSSFSSTNTSVATTTTGGWITCVGAGSSNIIASFTAVHPAVDSCPVPFTPSTGGGLTVNPTITTSGPSAVALGTNNTMTITATGNPAGGTYSWTTSSSRITLTNATSPTVTVTAVSESLSTNDNSIIASYTLNGQTASVIRYLTVQKPTSMAFVEVVSFGPRGCPAGKAGYQKVINWQVVDQFGQGIAFAMPTSDSGSYDSSNNTCSLMTYEGSTGTTGLGGGWQHTHWFCSTQCPTGCQTNGTQTFTVNGFMLSGLSFVYRCDSVSVAGH